MLKKVVQNIEEDPNLGQPVESVLPDPVEMDESTPLSRDEPTEIRDQSSSGLINSRAETLDPFEVKFSDRFSMFKSTVVGISSQVDNEAFLTRYFKCARSEYRMPQNLPDIQIVYHMIRRIPFKFRSGTQIVSKTRTKMCSKLVLQWGSE